MKSAEMTLVWGAVACGDVTSHEARLAAWLMSLSESIAWHERMFLRGVNFKWDDGTWLMVVKASRQTSPGASDMLVAFYTGNNMAECTQNFADAVAKRQVYWSMDKYA